MCNAHVWSPIRMSKLPGFYDKAHLFDVEMKEKKIKLKEFDYIEKGGLIASPVESPVGHIGLVIVRISTWIDFLETQFKPEWCLLILFFTVLRCEISWIQLVASSNGCRHHHISICFYRDHWSGSLGIPFESSSHRNAMFRRRRGSDGHFIIVNAHPTVTLWWVWPIFLIQNRQMSIYLDIHILPGYRSMGNGDSKNVEKGRVWH